MIRIQSKTDKDEGFSVTKTTENTRPHQQPAIQPRPPRHPIENLRMSSAAQQLFDCVFQWIFKSSFVNKLVYY